MKPSNFEKSEPWYRYPMVWFVFALPALVVAASIWTIILAHQSPPVLVPLTSDSASAVKTAE